jgi:hypothetical protein
MHMAKVRVDLESVQVTEGQGLDGDFELRVQVQEGANNMVWPSLNSSARVDKNGASYTINREVATYTIASGTLSKKFTMDVTEVDKGTLGQDDYGQGTLTFDLTPAMAPSTKSATISLKRPNMSYQGKVKVTLTAQRV